MKICDAMAFAHSRGVIHRDLKPSNLIIQPSNEGDSVKVVDFGIVKLTESNQTHTIPGVILGTPHYMAPEQARGEKVDHRCDIFTAGVLLYELLTTRPCYDEEDKGILLEKVKNADFVPPEKFRAGLSPRLLNILAKAMAVDPNERYQTAQALGDDLTHWLGGKPITARPVTWMERSWRWCKRKPTVAGLCATIPLLLLTLGIGGPVVAWQQTENARLEKRLRAEAQKNEQHARQLEEEQRKRADANFEVAQKTVDDFLTNVSESDLWDQPQMELQRRQLLEKARTYYQEFIQQLTDDPKPKAKLKPKPKAKPKPKPKPKPEAKPKPKPIRKLAKAKPRRKPKPPDAFTSVLRTVEKLKNRPPPKEKKKEDKKPEKKETFEQQVAQALMSRTARHDPLRSLAISEIDLVRQQIRECWSLPAGAKEAENLSIEIKMAMNPDGTVRQARILDQNRLQSDPFFRAAAESALRAVLNPHCNPLKLPPEKYQQWQNMILIFDPRDMF